MMRTPLQWLADRLGHTTLRAEFDPVKRETDLLRPALTGAVVALEAETTKVHNELQGMGANHAGAIAALMSRLAFYERTVPALSEAKLAYEAEMVRRTALVVLHPELSERGKDYVMLTGDLPPVADGSPQPGR